MTREQLVETMKKTFEEWNIPDNIKKKWINNKRTEEKFKTELLSVFKVQ